VEKDGVAFRLRGELRVGHTRTMPGRVGGKGSWAPEDRSVRLEAGVVIAR